MLAYDVYGLVWPAQKAGENSCSCNECRTHNKIEQFVFSGIVDCDSKALHPSHVCTARRGGANIFKCFQRDRGTIRIYVSRLLLTTRQRTYAIYTTIYYIHNESIDRVLCGAACAKHINIHALHTVTLSSACDGVVWCEACKHDDRQPFAHTYTMGEYTLICCKPDKHVCGSVTSRLSDSFVGLATMQLTVPPRICPTESFKWVGTIAAHIYTRTFRFFGFVSFVLVMLNCIIFLLHPYIISHPL